MSYNIYNKSNGKTVTFDDKNMLWFDSSIIYIDDKNLENLIRELMEKADKYNQLKKLLKD